MCMTTRLESGTDIAWHIITSRISLAYVVSRAVIDKLQIVHTTILVHLKVDPESCPEL